MTRRKHSVEKRDQGGLFTKMGLTVKELLSTTVNSYLAFSTPKGIEGRANGGKKDRKGSENISDVQGEETHGNTHMGTTIVE